MEKDARDRSEQEKKFTRYFLLIILLFILRSNCPEVNASESAPILETISYDELIETLGLDINKKRFEGSWLCVGNECFYFAKPTPYYTFYVNWDQLDLFLASRKGKPLGDVRWIHDHPLNIGGCSSVNFSPTLQDYSLYLGLNSYLERHDPNVSLTAEVISPYGNFDFIVKNPDRHFVSYNNFDHPTAYLKTASLWNTLYSDMRVNKNTTMEELKQLLAGQGIKLDLKGEEVLC